MSADYPGSIPGVPSEGQRGGIDDPNFPTEPIWARQIQQLTDERNLARRQLAELKDKDAKLRRLLGVARDEFNHLRGTVDELLTLVRSGQ